MNINRRHAIQRELDRGQYTQYPTTCSSGHQTSDIEVVEKGAKKATKGLKNLQYKQQLQYLGLLSKEEWSLRGGDMTEIYQTAW